MYVLCFCIYVKVQPMNIEQNWGRKKHMWIVYSTLETKHSEQIYCRFCCQTQQNWSKTTFSQYIIEIETKLFRFFFIFFCTFRHCSCSVLTIIHAKRYSHWIRLSFSIPVFMFIFDPNKETIVNDVLQEIQRNHPNRKIKSKKKKNSNETQNVNWIQWFRGLDIVSR